jgi:enamine deaminase RidA (YjgF/YER057c/UK114 family)
LRAAARNSAVRGEKPSDAQDAVAPCKRSGSRHAIGAILHLKVPLTFMRYLTPPGIRPPFAHYSHGVEVPAAARLLFASGQLGITPADEIPEDAGAQADLCFRAIAEVLKAAGMEMSDLVRINAFVTDRAYLKPYMDARDRHVGSPPPASTLMIVSGFARPDFKVEVEAIAAKVDHR